MKNYAKAVLYAYPLLATVEEDYEAHIKNMALLSFDNRKSAEEAATEIAEEILEMRRLEWLKGKINEVLGRLTAVERMMVAIRYFGKVKKIKSLFQKPRLDNPLQGKALTERTYFRKQQRLGERLGVLLHAAGVTESVFTEEFLPMEIFAKIYRGVVEGKDRKISCNERKWLGI